MILLRFKDKSKNVFLLCGGGTNLVGQSDDENLFMRISANFELNDKCIFTNSEILW